jgi:hypothetical protein
MKMRTRFHFAAVCFIILLATGCPPFPKASDEFTRQARQFKPSPGRAAVYVIRPAQFVAAGSFIGVWIDHKKFGKLPPRSFLYTEVLPREHVLELTEVINVKNISHRFVAEEGKCYFFTAEVLLSAKMSLSALSEEEGKQLVSDYDQSGSNAFDAGKESPTKPQ